MIHLGDKTKGFVTDKEEWLRQYIHKSEMHAADPFAMCAVVGILIACK
jgi:hypothetical protein